MARPVKPIDTKTVEAMAAIGCTTEEIASVVGCSRRLLQTRYCALMENGRSKRNESLRRMQWKAACAGNVAMLIWLGKQYLGQSDKQDVNHGNTDAGALQIEIIHTSEGTAPGNRSDS